MPGERDQHELISQPKYKVKVEKDLRIKMPDGVHEAADIYHHDVRAKFPALLGVSCYGKDIRKFLVSDAPINPLLGNRDIEAKDK